MWTECLFCGQVSGVISGRAGCPCSRPFFLGPCAVSLDTANEKMAAGQPGPLTLLWPVFRAPTSHLPLNRCAGWPSSTAPTHWKHFSSSSLTRLRSAIFTRSIIFYLKQLVYFHLRPLFVSRLLFFIVFRQKLVPLSVEKRLSFFWWFIDDHLSSPDHILTVTSCSCMQFFNH